MIEFIVVFFSLLIIIVLWLSIGIRHILLEKRDIGKRIDFLGELFYKRYSLTAILVEVVSKKVNIEEKKNLIIQHRDNALKIREINVEKRKAEKEVERELIDLINFGNTNPDLKKNGYFLEISSEISYVNEKIKISEEKLKEIIQKYNKDISSFFYILCAKIIGAKKFDWEQF